MALPSILRWVVMCIFLSGTGVVRAEESLAPVGMRQVEFDDKDRTLALTLFYPAKIDGDAKPFFMPFFANVNVFKDAPLLIAGAKRPLIMFSHGRGSNGLYYAWFAEHLAARGFIVAAINHYHANTYDSHVAYLSGRLWQRPIDVGLAISFLLHEPDWAPMVDPARIGVAGHSQGGFTSLWIGGAEVNADRYRAFQARWHNDPMIPEHLRREIPVDPEPALHVRDPRVRAAFAMAPGIVKAFGMDETGLKKMTIPVYITVGARDTQTPPGPNAEFAAANIPGAQLAIIPGPVDHEIFVNECNEEGRDEFPEACIDAPGVDRAAIHEAVGGAAVRFFREAFGVAAPQ